MKFMKKSLLAFILLFTVFALVACEDDPVEPDLSAPTFSGVAAVTLANGATFNPLTGVTATDSVDGNLTSSITFTVAKDAAPVASVVTTTAGLYVITYSVTNSRGVVGTATRNVTVSPAVTVVDGEFVNYKFANTELRHTFMAAAEEYLLKNMYAGVPVFANAGFSLFSSRLSLKSEVSLPVLGFGTGSSTLTADDSTVKINGQFGAANQYTYRTAFAQNPTTLNQWIYQDATSADTIGLFLDSLYSFEFNASNDGYVVAPAMASGAPTPTAGEVLPSGATVANVWRVPLRNNLDFYFHPDLPGRENLDSEITAQTFIDTFKLALDEGWFRAVAGGGDFFSASQGIKGAKAYYDSLGTANELDFETTVGLKAVGDYTIEFEFINQLSEWNVKYWLSSFVVTPVSLDLYDLVGNRYGTDPLTTAYHGEFYLDSYTPDQLIVMKSNPNYTGAKDNNYTGYNIAIIEDAEVRFQEFVAGNLEAGSVPTARFDQFKNDPRLKNVPGSTTFRLMINGTGDVATQKDLFPDSTRVPEPLLALTDFKLAMYYAIDRRELALDVLKTSQPQQYLFTDAYLVDPELGVPYRQTPQGLDLDVAFKTSYGFNAVAATNFFLKALKDSLDDGDYQRGTAANYTIIEIDFYIFSGSQAQELLGQYIKDSFEKYFVDPVNFVKVQVNVETKPFPSIYFDFMMKGQFDLAIGGISGSTLDAASFLDTYSSDNRSGFTLNWGIDTSVAEIPVTYDKPQYDADGDLLFDADGDVVTEEVTEIWSFDAIYAVLNGNAFISNGQESTPPPAA